MAFERHSVEVGRTELNEPIICCAHCHLPAHYAQSVTERAEASFELVRLTRTLEDPSRLALGPGKSNE